MANYTFIFQAVAPDQVAFSWMAEGVVQPLPVYMTKDDTVSFSLLPAVNSLETMNSITLTYVMKESGEPVSPFQGEASTFTWANGGPDLTLVNVIGQWCFSGVLTAESGGQTVTYTLADPEVVVDDGPPPECAAKAA